MTKTKQVDFKLFRSALESIRRETRPIEGHTDPESIKDCWDEVFEDLDALEAKESALSKLDDLEKDF
jgi:hypothetical protein